MTPAICSSYATVLKILLLKRLENCSTVIFLIGQPFFLLDNVLIENFGVLYATNFLATCYIFWLLLFLSSIIQMMKIEKILKLSVGKLPIFGLLMSQITKDKNIRVSHKITELLKIIKKC